MQRARNLEVQALDLAGYFDVTIGPTAALAQKADWQTKKLPLLGPDRLRPHLQGRGRDEGRPEERGIVSLFAGSYIPAGILVEARTRADLRWDRRRLLDALPVPARGEPRLRRVGPRGHAVRPGGVPLRHSIRRVVRELYVVGAEMAFTKHFRIEPSVARQLDRLPRALQGSTRSPLSHGGYY